MTDLTELRNPRLLIPHLQARVQRDGVSGGGKAWAILVPYIDARAAATILDRALGPGGWSFALKQAPAMAPGGKGYMTVGRLTLHVGDDPARWPSYDGIGTAGGDALDTGVAGSGSSALKRAATLAGVGRALYRLGELFADSQYLSTREKGGKTYVNVSDAGLAAAIETWRGQLAQLADRFDAQRDDSDAATDAATMARAHSDDADGDASGPAVDPVTGEVLDPAGGGGGGGEGGQSDGGWPADWSQARVDEVLGGRGAGEAEVRFTALRLQQGGDRGRVVEVCKAAGLTGPGELADGDKWVAALRQAGILVREAA